MRDINFFQEINVARKATHHKMLLTALVPLFLITMLVVAFGAIRMTSSKISTDTVRLKQFLQSAEVLKAKKEYEEKKMKLDILNKYNSSLDSINASLESIDTIKPSLMDELKSALPKDTVFKSVAMSNGSVKIAGECSSRVTAAELLHNLGNVDVLENVRINSITKSIGTSQAFTLDADLKGGIEK